MEIVKLKVSVLEPNTGQIEGLPKNPRQWRKEDIDSLARSLKETPELFEARPLLVYPLGGKYVILGGNMRFVAARANKAKEVPAVVFPADTPLGKLKELVLKDNGSFGTWDYDELANSWDDLPLIDWGVPSWEGHADCQSYRKLGKRLGLSHTTIRGEIVRIKAEIIRIYNELKSKGQ